MQTTNSEAFPTLEGYAVYIRRMEFRMLEVRENEISLRKLSGGTTHLCTLGWTLLVVPNIGEHGFLAT